MIIGFRRMCVEVYEAMDVPPYATPRCSDHDSVEVFAGRRSDKANASRIRLQEIMKVLECGRKT